MKLAPLLQQRPSVTPQLVVAGQVLQLSAAELEQTIAREVAENPVLELVEVKRCPRCGQPLSACRCVSSTPPDGPAARAEPVAAGDDPVSRLAARETLAEALLRQARLYLSHRDLPIAADLIGNLDHHGFLRCDLDQVASRLGVEQDRVEMVLAVVQKLDPVGIGARDARECLLIQLDHLRQRGVRQELAETLIAERWNLLGRRAPAEIARAVGATVEQVQEALQFIRDNLNPYPAHAYRAGLPAPPEEDRARLRPDIIIRGRHTPAGIVYEIELPGEHAYPLRISPSLVEATRSLIGQEWEQWGALYTRARLLIRSLEQRWRTLRRLAEYLVDYQQPFLARGRRFLRPLTRAQLAWMMGVHESTVSRAVADKLVQLPNGQIMPLADFFDRSTAVKEAIKEIIAQEDRPMSDREIAIALAERGYRVSRRTVAKYRNALQVLPSTLRRRAAETQQWGEPRGAD